MRLSSFREARLIAADHEHEPRTAAGPHAGRHHGAQDSELTRHRTDLATQANAR
jgi:hypothetical protein